MKNAPEQSPSIKLRAEQPGPDGFAALQDNAILSTNAEECGVEFEVINNHAANAAQKRTNRYEKEN